MISTTLFHSPDVWPTRRRTVRMASSGKQMAENSEESAKTTGNFGSVQLEAGEEIKNDFLINEENLSNVLECKLKEEIAAQSLILSALSGGISNIRDLPPNVGNIVSSHGEISGEQNEQSDLNFDVSQAIGVEMIAIQQDGSDVEVKDMSSSTAEFMNPSLSGSAVVLNAIAIKGENGVTEIQFEGTDMMDQSDVDVIHSQPQHETEIGRSSINEDDISFATAEIELSPSEPPKYPSLFVATTAHEAHEIIKRYAEETMSTFVSMRKMKQFGITGIYIASYTHSCYFISLNVFTPMPCAGIFFSSFLPPLNSGKNSILYSVIKLNLIICIK